MQTGLDFDDVLIIPKYSKIKSRHDVKTIMKLGKHKFRIPIIAANMDRICDSTMAREMNRLGGLGVIHRFNTIDVQYEEAHKTGFDSGPIAVALGLNDLEERARRLAPIAHIFVIDIAHGHSYHTLKAVEYLRKNFSEKYIIAGNVATRVGACDLHNAGADCIKIGIGPGKVCKTRTTTGCGIPQLTAIQNITKNANYDTIADGGINSSGDIVKSLAAGATAVMIGYLLAGTKETPGRTFTKDDGSRFKFYRGMSSYEANNRTDVASEGKSIEVPYKGSAETVTNGLIMGLKSGMSYVGAHTLDELVKKAEFMRQIK